MTVTALADMPTEELQDLYRAVRTIVDGADVLDPWVDVAAAAAHELRLRIAANWLHAGWCPVYVCPCPVEHLASVADAARKVVIAFDAGRGLTEAVYQAMTPDGAAPARGTAELSVDSSFHRLIADLVTVVPSEVAR